MIENKHGALRIALSVALLGVLGWAAAGDAHHVTHAATSAVWTMTSGQEQPADVAAQVKIDNFNFAPREITVAVGTTITWVNQDDVPHTVVSNDDKFTSKALDTDDKYSFKFTEAGTYEYYCSVHPKMVGRVIVK
jgi:plastocyanin